MTTISCCAECGEEGGASLKVCKACMQIRYCNAKCQRNHWSNHKKDCKRRAAELRDKALFKDPPDKEDCPICFLPMTKNLVHCVSLPPATISSVPIYDYAEANEALVGKAMEIYYPCCGKTICKGCVHSFHVTGNIGKCPFCNSYRGSSTDEEMNEEIMRRVEANDPNSIYMLSNSYYRGSGGLQQDRTKAVELMTKAAELGCSIAHYNLGRHYDEGGDLKKAKFHYEAAAMAGHEDARYKLGEIEHESGNMERAIRHWAIAASAGDCEAMHTLITIFNKALGGWFGRELFDSILTSYNNSCAEMRSEARDAFVRMYIDCIAELEKNEI